MKRIHTLLLTTLLIALSTTTVQCMKQNNATLEVYDCNKIKQIKKERNEFEKLCSVEPKPTSEDILKKGQNVFQHTYHNTENLRIFLQSGYAIAIFHGRYAYGYSPIAAAIIGKNATLPEKKELIKRLYTFTFPMQAIEKDKELAFIEKDKELAFLELYERKLQHWKTICLLILAQHTDKTNSFTLLPVELIQCISHLITQTEKSLL